MKATEILMEEHRLIERVLNALETSANRVMRGEDIQPTFFINAALFIKNFADGCHHRKEEGVLFVAMHEAGIPVQGGPIGMMLSEHEQGRAFTKAMREAAENREKSDLAAWNLVTQNALWYVALLRQHIIKEEKILFPMADKVIPIEEQEKVMTDFKRVERDEIGEGVHEEYLALAEVLEMESLK